jgi:DNA-directed RNA polymerase subunit alpha
MTLPKVESVLTAENYGRFKIEPLDPGYGITVGNALRRVLLSSLPGAAITTVRIDGVYHEFSTIPHVREDVVELILNIKRIRLRCHTDRTVRMQLRARGEGVVRAGDIETPGNVEIVNPELVIATLDSPEARLDMEFTVERGRGYVPAEARTGLPIGVIPVDAVFTPVHKVNYVVEHTRVGQQTDRDRLILEIWTDGTITPGDALTEAGKILVRHFQLVAEFASERMGPGPRVPELTISVPGAEDPIEELDLSVRTYNCLKRANITKIGNILAMEKRDLLSIRQLGEKSLEELIEKLEQKGYISRERPGNTVLEQSLLREAQSGAVETIEEQ